MSVSPERRRKDDNVSRWVCFGVSDQIYGLPILAVQEVLREAQIEPVPGAAPQVLGVINLRGNVITVLDLRLRLGFPAPAAGAESRIVVVDHRGESFGLLVDRVADVRKVIDAAVKPAPNVGAGNSSARVHGVYTRDGELVTLLDPGSLIEETHFLS